VFALFIPSSDKVRPYIGADSTVGIIHKRILILICALKCGNNSFWGAKKSDIGTMIMAHNPTLNRILKMLHFVPYFENWLA